MMAGMKSWSLGLVMSRMGRHEVFGDIDDGVTHAWLHHSITRVYYNNDLTILNRSL